MKYQPIYRAYNRMHKEKKHGLGWRVETPLTLFQVLMSLISVASLLGVAFIVFQSVT